MFILICGYYHNRQDSETKSRQLYEIRDHRTHTIPEQEREFESEIENSWRQKITREKYCFDFFLIYNIYALFTFTRIYYGNTLCN